MNRAGISLCLLAAVCAAAWAQTSQHPGSSGGATVTYCSDTVTTNCVAKADGSGVTKLPGALNVGSALLDQINGYMGPNNASALRSTITKIAASQVSPPSQVRIVVWGDSVSNFHAASVAAGLRDMLSTTRGSAAGLLIGCGGTSSLPTGQVNQCPAGANPVTDYTHFPTQGYLVASGTCNTFVVDGGYFYGNKLSLFYVKEPNAGTLTLKTNKARAGWVSGPSADANAALAGAVLTTTMGDTGPYEIQACASGGAVNVWGPGFENTAVSGAVIAQVSLPGLALTDANSTPAAITAPWYAAINPDLITYEMKETSAGYLAALQTFVSRWTTANALADFLFIASSPIATNDSNQVAQNAILKSVAQANNAYYWDGYYPALNYATQKALGWITDEGSPHQTDLGQAAESNLLWRDLGLSGLINGAGFRNLVAGGNVPVLQTGAGAPTSSCVSGHELYFATTATAYYGCVPGGWRPLQYAQGQNFLLYSEDFTNAAWANSSVTVTATAGIGPDGTQGSAQRLQIATSGILYQSLTSQTLIQGPYTFSIWLKTYGATNQTVRLRLYDQLSNTYYSSDLTVTPSWQRFSVAATLAANVSNVLIGTGVGNSAADVLAFGAQLSTGLTTATYSKTTTTVNP